MYQYSWLQWLFFFFFYSFFGWCFESTFVSIQQKKPVNRGFIRGPFLPLYGTGALMMLVVSMPFADHLFFTYLAGCVGATVLEYITGVLMEALFKVRYWDYSNQKFNFQGQICLSSTLAWGGLTLLMTRVVHRGVEALVLRIPNALLTGITLLALVVFVADFTLSFRAALDMREVLGKMEQARLELVGMQSRLRSMLGIAEEAVGSLKRESGERLAESREGIAQKWEELTGSVEGLFVKIKEMLPGSALLSGKMEELLELRSRFRLQEQRMELTHFIGDMMKRAMLKGNPNMVSKKFAGALEDLKRSVADYRKKNKDEE